MSAPAKSNESTLLEFSGGSPRAIRALRNIVRISKSFIVFLSKTKCHKNRMNFVKFSLGLIMVFIKTK